jgi:hypothetical protein
MKEENKQKHPPVECAGLHAGLKGAHQPKAMIQQGVQAVHDASSASVAALIHLRLMLLRTTKRLCSLASKLCLLQARLSSCQNRFAKSVEDVCKL